MPGAEEQHLSETAGLNEKAISSPETTYMKEHNVWRRREEMAHEHERGVNIDDHRLALLRWAGGNILIAKDTNAAHLMWRMAKQLAQAMTDRRRLRRHVDIQRNGQEVGQSHPERSRQDQCPDRWTTRAPPHA